MIALVIIWVVCVCVKNTVQDVSHAITGRVPPSFVREQRRIARREARRPITANRADRKFFRNAYNDAWESAEEMRARRHAKRGEHRRERWADQDAEPGKTPAPLTGAVEPEEKIDTPAPTVTGPMPVPLTPTPTREKPATQSDPETSRKQESLYQRYGLRRRNGGASLTAIAVADELGTSVAEATALQKDWDARYQKENPPPATDQTATPREERDQQVERLANAVSPITKENDNVTVNAETTGLTTAIAYADGMAASAEEGAASVETSVASLQNGKVGGSALGHFANAQELLNQAAAAFRAGQAELQQDLTVREAYEARPDAGSKEFVTAD